MRFWLDMGVDGFRLDAIPYLVRARGHEQREPARNARGAEASCGADRLAVSERAAAREANQWPEDVREYFGNGDECHMAYHFPLMPRMYMAIAQEERHPITEIMAQTPDIPESCQWAIFLRNHDELTLEMVTSRERDYMYNMYAGRQARADQPRHPPAPRAAARE
jgi:maltose alpha-D-glucosyltransferase/alpha-amylase